jgi:sigma-E factor negative regulatory protein RseB
MVFSDGLAGISIFIENLSDNADVNPGLSSQGIIQIYSKAIDDEHLVTVVGEVPPQTVMQVADSVRYTGE